jgi:hypothetical protein
MSTTIAHVIAAGVVQQLSLKNIKEGQARPATL